MDNGNAGFSSSAGARNVMAGLNPMTPGGMSPKNTHLPTLGWAVMFLVALFLVYHFILKGKR